MPTSSGGARIVRSTVSETIKANERNAQNITAGQRVQNAKGTEQERHDILATRSLPNMPQSPQRQWVTPSSSVGSSSVASPASISSSTPSGSIRNGPITQKQKPGPSGQNELPPWVHPNAFFRSAKPEPLPKQLEKVEIQEEKKHGFIRSQIHGLKKFGLMLQNNELQKFLHCIALRVGCVVVAITSIIYSLLCLTMFVLILVFYPDWKFIYRDKMDLLVFIMYHLAIRVFLAIFGIILVIGIVQQSDLILRISLYGFWVHLALNWLGLGALAAFCSVQGYCFQNQFFPTLLFMFFITMVYSWFWLYSIWTVNSYRILEVDDDVDDDDEDED